MDDPIRKGNMMRKVNLLHLIRSWTASILALVLLLCVPLGCAEAPAMTPEVPGVPLMTRYMQMDFPEIYSAAVTIEVMELEDASIINATTLLGEQEILLYTLILTTMDISAEEALVLGWLQDEELGRINIVLQLEEQLPESWSEAEYMWICELQETVNHLLMQLMEDPRYDPGVL